MNEVYGYPSQVNTSIPRALVEKRRSTREPGGNRSHELRVKSWAAGLWPAVNLIQPQTTPGPTKGHLIPSY